MVLFNSSEKRKEKKTYSGENPAIRLSSIVSLYTIFKGGVRIGLTSSLSVVSTGK